MRISAVHSGLSEPRRARVPTTTGAAMDTRTPRDTHVRFLELTTHESKCATSN